MSISKSLVLALALFSISPAFAQTGKTVLIGVYTDAQAARGEAEFKTSCSGCHGDSLEGNFGPALKGEKFLDDFREDTLDPVFTFMRTSMPAAGIVPGAVPGGLPEATYLDLLSFILKQNGYRAGSEELTAAATSGILMVGLNGPQPLPNLSQVIAVGCFVPGAKDSEWKLTGVGDLARARELEKTTPEELKASASRGLGAKELRLAKIDDLANFNPGEKKGHKVQAKGILYTDPKNTRINVTTIESLAATCAL